MAIHNSKPSRDWSKYTEALVNRGKLTLFITKDFADTWYVKWRIKDSNATLKDL
jgi:hypothetical protein